jgi:putative transposase
MCTAPSQILTHMLRLPDERQAAAVRLLAATRQTVNAMWVALWPRLDAFAHDADVSAHQAWKQLTALVAAPHANGSRQWRCEAETAGRILRSQAARKAAFEALRPVLTEGLIQPATEQSRARKDRRALLQTVQALRAQVGDEAEALGLRLHVAEQACNVYLEHDRFPADYFELQRVPVLEADLLTFAADDGPAQGQAYRLALARGRLRLPCPDDRGAWGWLAPVEIPLPGATRALLAKGVPAAPQLRAQVQPDQTEVAVLDLVFEVPAAGLPDLADCRRVLAFDGGVRKLLTVAVLNLDSQQVSRPLFFDTGGFDGRQARLRRQIDQLNAKQASSSARWSCAGRPTTAATGRWHIWPPTACSSWPGCTVAR